MKLIDQVLYADILQCKRTNGKILFEDENAIVIHSITSNIYYCAAANAEGAKELIKYLPNKIPILVAHDVFTDSFLQERFHKTYEFRCYHCGYIKEEKPVVVLPKGYEIYQLTTAHVDEIISMYRHSMESLATKDYIESCLEDGMYGVFYGIELCGFIGVHEKESMGLLEIKESYRHKGLAIALECYMIGKQMDRGRIPYGEIKEDNEASMFLSKKAGMVLSDATYWYFLDEE